MKNMLRRIVNYIKWIFSTEPIPTTIVTLRKSMTELEIARNHFNNCEPEYMDAAIFELNAAECRWDAVRRCMR